MSRGESGGVPGSRPRPRSLFCAVQQDPGEAALAAARGDQQRAVDDLLHPHGQPAAGPRLHAPRPGPAPAPRRVSPARDAARRPPDVTKLRSGRPPRAGRGRGEGRAGHRRPWTRAWPCGLHTRRGDALRSPTEGAGWAGMGQGRAPPPATPAASASREDLRAGAGRTPGPRPQGPLLGGRDRPGAPAPLGPTVSPPLLAPALPSRVPGFPAFGSGARVATRAPRGGSLGGASRKPGGPARGGAGHQGDTAATAAARGSLDDPRVLGASPGDGRTRARPQVAFRGLRESDLPSSLSRMAAGSGFCATPGAVRAPRGLVIMGRTAFPSESGARRRASPAAGWGIGGAARSGRGTPARAPLRRAFSLVPVLDFAEHLSVPHAARAPGPPPGPGLLQVTLPRAPRGPARSPKPGSRRSTGHPQPAGGRLS